METTEKKPWTKPLLEYYDSSEGYIRRIERLQNIMMVNGNKLYDDPDNEELREKLRVDFVELCRLQEKYKKSLQINHLLNK